MVFCQVEIHAGDHPFFRIPAKQEIAGSNHVFAPEAVLVFFTMKYLKGLKFFYFIIVMAFMVIITHPPYFRNFIVFDRTPFA